jgi:hypothetical protein
VQTDAQTRPIRVVRCFAKVKLDLVDHQIAALGLDCAQGGFYGR